MEFNPGFDIIPTVNPMGFKYVQMCSVPKWRIVICEIFGEVYPTLSAMALKSFIP